MATNPFNIKIRKITDGSTQDGIPCSSSFSSNYATINDTIADKSKIRTKLSSN